MSNSKSWPIKSDTSCYLKWAWSTIYLNKGTTASCHRTVHNHFDVDNFEQFHNLPKKVDDRRRMLEGKWPAESESDKYGLSGCTYCKYLEDHGGHSDRMVQLNNISGVFENHNNVIPPELLENPNAVEVTPTIVEVYFNNVCNMACLYCGPHFSTMWEEENRRFEAKEDGILVNPSWERDKERYDATVEKFFSWLQENGHKIWNFGMLGGEPFYQKEFDRLLDHWDKYPNPDLMLTIVTNLKIEHNRLIKYVERLQKLVDEKKIKFLNLSCSMDCVGEPAEYQRWGLNYSDWEKNFDYLAQFEWIVLNVNITITPLSIRTLPPLFEKLNYLDTKRLETKHITTSFMHVVEPSQLNPKNFGPGVFTEDFKQILDSMPMVTEYQRNYKNYMEGIANSIEKSTRDPKQIRKLELYLEEMDRRRGTNWKDVFPWLIPEFEKNHEDLKINKG